MGLWSYHRALSLVQNMQILGQLFEPLYINSAFLRHGISISCSMLLSYHPTTKSTYTDQTSQPHHLTLSLAKKNMKLRKLYATEIPPDAALSWSDGRNIQPKKTLEFLNRIEKIQRLPLQTIKNSILLYLLSHQLPANKLSLKVLTCLPPVLLLSYPSLLIPPFSTLLSPTPSLISTQSL